MTRELLEKLPPNVRRTIESNRAIYGEARRNGNDLVRKERSAIVRGYCAALYDTGIITDAERRALFCYATI